MSRFFLTSDWHIGEQSTPNTHSFLRPQPTEIMVEGWIDQCHRLIRPDDTLIFVGDVGITLEDLHVCLKLPSCNKIMVLGDKEYANKKFSLEDFVAKNDELGVFHWVVQNSMFNIGGRGYFVSHKPTDCLGKGRPAICGHVHGIWRTSCMPSGHPIINVGIDAWGGLVTEDFLEHQYNAVTKNYYDIEAMPTQWRNL